MTALWREGPAGPREGGCGQVAGGPRVHRPRAVLGSGNGLLFSEGREAAEPVNLINDHSSLSQ